MNHFYKINQNKLKYVERNANKIQKVTKLHSELVKMHTSGRKFNIMSNINQKEILDKIKHEICRSHPILKPRKNNEINEIAVMEIYFTFGATYDDKPITAIGFLDGDENSRSSTSAFYRLDEYINLKIVNELISYLIIEYPYISDFSLSTQSFSLSFSYPLEMEDQEGISCDKIILEFKAHTKEFIPILNKYLSNILVQFTNELSQTSTFQNKYAEYCDNLQINILDSLNEEEIEQMIKLLPVEMKRRLLQELPSQYFLQFYQEKYSPEEKNLAKQLVKNETKLPKF